MKAAVVRAAGQSPAYGDFDEPRPGAGEVMLSVRAGAITQLARARASGRHYSAGGGFPFVAGVDGVGVDPEGRRVVFAFPRAPFGALAERTVVAAANLVPIPDALEDVRAAALANAGMSSWLALTRRARVRPGETVLVNGATGASGRLAVRVARHLGAGRVIATGRNRRVLSELGADAVLVLDGDEDRLATELRETFAAGVDIVLDYLWGASAQAMLIAAAQALPDAHPLRFVQIGSVSGGEISLPGAALRAKAIELMGSGIGSVGHGELIASVGEMLAAAPAAGLDLPTRAVPLAEVEAAWAAAEDGARTVLVI